MPAGIGYPPPMGGINPQNAQALQAAGMGGPPPMQGQPGMMPPQGMPPMGGMPPAQPFDFFKKPQLTPDQQAEVARKLARALANRQ